MIVALEVRLGPTVPAAALMVVVVMLLLLVLPLLFVLLLLLLRELLPFLLRALRLILGAKKLSILP